MRCVGHANRPILIGERNLVHVSEMADDEPGPDPWTPNARAGKLQSAVDDEINPTTITVFSRECDDITTAWMSVDIEYAIHLDDAI